ncbi:MAG: hypothetical protein ACLFUB_00670 [Cyclobacteriaceae bacterium]
MRKMNRQLIFLLLSFFMLQPLLAQEDETNANKTYPYKPLTLKIDDNTYIRTIIWNQIWLETNNLSDPNADFRVTPQIRRARMLFLAQISPRFLILSHLGMNSETSVGHHPLGESSQVSLFFHEVWGEYKLNDNIYLGMGLHYWNGLSRLTSQSTLNFMTLDAPLFNWAQLGLSDQFARHLGVYAKGNFGKFNYRVSVNDALDTSLDDLLEVAPTTDRAAYSGAALGAGDNRFIAQGYFHYELLDAESSKLPYFVGSYLGTKNIFNIGAGFFHHTNGTVSLADGAGETFDFHNVNHFAIDAFYDAPLGDNGSAINALLAYYNFDFGPNYFKSVANPGRSVATGGLFYAQLGYLLPGEGMQDRFMPYVTYANGNPEAFEDNTSIFKLGMNYFMNGHNSKMTLEYTNTITPVETGTVNSDVLTLQMHVFL